jgi:hypothetical protein
MKMVTEKAIRMVTTDPMINPAINPIIDPMINPIINPTIPSLTKIAEKNQISKSVAK